MLESRRVGAAARSAACRREGPLRAESRSNRTAQESKRWNGVTLCNHRADDASTSPTFLSRFGPSVITPQRLKCFVVPSWRTDLPGIIATNWPAFEMRDRLNPTDMKRAEWLTNSVNLKRAPIEKLNRAVIWTRASVFNYIGIDCLHTPCWKVSLSATIKPDCSDPLAVVQAGG